MLQHQRIYLGSKTRKKIYNFPVIENTQIPGCLGESRDHPGTRQEHSPRLRPPPDRPGRVTRGDTGFSRLVKVGWHEPDMSSELLRAISDVAVSPERAGFACFMRWRAKLLHRGSIGASRHIQFSTRAPEPSQRDLSCRRLAARPTAKNPLHEFLQIVCTPPERQ